jgi:DedD protein
MKQRLVGALILVCLAILFWPIIFVPGVDEQSSFSVEVPGVPPVDLTPLPEPDNAGLRAGSDAQAQLEAREFAAGLKAGDVPLETDSLPSREEVVPVPEVEEGRDRLASPPLDADGLPIAYALQVATITRADRAEALRDELIAAGYKAYLKSLRREDRRLYRVMVGPRFSRDELEPIKSAIDDAWRVQSLIIRYVP